MVTTGREYTVELVAAPLPSSIAQNGKPLPENDVEGVPGSWARRGGTTVITLLPTETAVDTQLTVC